MAIENRVNVPVSNEARDRLYSASWPNHHAPHEWGPELERLLVFSASGERAEEACGARDRAN
jgi:hypothetical protein